MIQYLINRLRNRKPLYNHREEVGARTLRPLAALDILAGKAGVVPTRVPEPQLTTVEELEADGYNVHITTVKNPYYAGYAVKPYTGVNS